MAGVALSIIQLGLQFVQIWQQERMIDLQTQWQNRDMAVRTAHLRLAEVASEDKLKREEQERLGQEIDLFLREQKSLFEAGKYLEAADKAQTAITLLFKKESAIEAIPTREIAKLQWINFTICQAMALFSNGDYEASRDILSRINATPALPPHSSIKLFLGLCYERLGEKKAAEFVLRSSAELYPDNDLIQIIYQCVKEDYEQVLRFIERNPALLRTEALASFFAAEALINIPRCHEKLSLIPLLKSAFASHLQNPLLYRLFKPLLLAKDCELNLLLLEHSIHPISLTEKAEISTAIFDSLHQLLLENRHHPIQYKINRHFRLSDEPLTELRPAQIAQAFMKGDKVRVDIPEANSYFRLAFIQMAQENFSKNIRSEEDPSLLESERLSLYQTLADLTPGYRKAMRYLAQCYETGTGAPYSRERAKYYFQKLYLEGAGTLDNDVQAAMLNLAILLEDGTATNTLQARSLYARAKAWSAEAAWREANLYYSGRGAPTHWETAKALYEIIYSEPGDRFTAERKTEALYRIARIEKSQGNLGCKAHFLRAAETGHREAAYEYALSCETAYNNKVSQPNLEGDEDFMGALQYFKIVADRSSDSCSHADQAQAAFKYAGLRRQQYSISLLYKDAFRELNRDQEPKAFQIKREVDHYYHLADRLGIKEASDARSSFNRSAIAMNIASSPASLASSVVELGKSCSIQ